MALQRREGTKNQVSMLHPVELAELRVENAKLQRSIDQTKKEMHAQKLATAKSGQASLLLLETTQLDKARPVCC